MRDGRSSRAPPSRRELLVLHVVASVAALAAAAALGLRAVCLIGSRSPAQPDLLGAAGSPLVPRRRRAARARHRLRRGAVRARHRRGGRHVASRVVAPRGRAVPPLLRAHRAEGLPRPRGRRALREADDPAALRQGRDLRGEPLRARRGRRRARARVAAGARARRAAARARDRVDAPRTASRRTTGTRSRLRSASALVRATACCSASSRGSSSARTAPPSSRPALLAAGVAAVFCLSFLSLASRPEAVTIGYKG